MIDIDNGGDDESYLVLEKHHQKNRTVRPPDPRTNGKAAALAAPSFHRSSATSSAPAAHSSGNASRKNHPIQSSATSSAPRAAPKPVPHAQASSGASRTIHATQPSSGPPQPSQAHGNNKSGNTRNTNNNDDDNTVDTDDNDGDVSDAAAGITIRRRSNLKTERLPTQLRFYSGCWVDVLKDAKYHYRLHIHTEEPFPERSRNSLTVAHERLLEAIGKFQEEVKLELDGGLLQFFSIEIY